MTPEHKEALAEGRKRAAAERALRAEPADGATDRTVSVTYIPLDVLDPNMTVWNGVTFKANIPVTLSRDNPRHFVEQLLPEEFVHPVDGRRMTRHNERMMFMGDLAKNNPSFEVDGVRAQRKAATRYPVPPPGTEWSEGHRTEAMNVAAAAWDGAS